jgi:hypothetical protein
MRGRLDVFQQFRVPQKRVVIVQAKRGSCLFLSFRPWQFRHVVYPKPSGPLRRCLDVIEELPEAREPLRCAVDSAGWKYKVPSVSFSEKLKVPFRKRRPRGDGIRQDYWFTIAAEVICIDLLDRQPMPSLNRLVNFRQVRCVRVLHRDSVWGSNSGQIERNRHVARELLSITNAFDECKIPFPTFRGAPLAILLYGDFPRSR